MIKPKWHLLGLSHTLVLLHFASAKAVLCPLFCFVGPVLELGCSRAPSGSVLSFPVPETSSFTCSSCAWLTHSTFPVLGTLCRLPPSLFPLVLWGEGQCQWLCQQLGGHREKLDNVPVFYSIKAYLQNPLFILPGHSASCP